MIIKSANVSPVLLVALSVAHYWTLASGQQPQEKNSMSFATTSTTTSSSPLTTDPEEKEQSERTLPLLQPALQPLVMQSKPRIPRNRNSERDLITRVRLLPRDKLNRYKMEAARQLQASLIRTFQALSSPGEKIPGNVKVAARRALAATQAGNYNSAIVRHLPGILQQGSQQQGQPAKQLQTIISSILPNVPSSTRGPLQGVLGFLTANVSNVNTLLVRVLGTVPDLLAGVIKSLTLNLGAVTGVLNGTVASLGILLGGVLG